jgi:RNA methyltransferase, TrmH family
VQDPGNVGTLIRSAEAAGATGAVLLKGCADLFSPKVLRSAMGSAFRLPIAIGVSAAELLNQAQRSGLQLWSASGEDSAIPYTEVDWAQRMALILGNEGNGIQEPLLTSSHGQVYIPMAGMVESLNVATAGAVLLFERARINAGNYKNHSRSPKIA